MSLHLMHGFEMGLLLHAWWSDGKQRRSVSPIIHQPFHRDHCQNNNINTNPHINSLNIAFICLVRAQQKHSHPNHGQCLWIGKIYALTQEKKNGVDPEFFFAPWFASYFVQNCTFFPIPDICRFFRSCYRCWVSVCVHAISVVWCICKWVLNWLQMESVYNQNRVNRKQKWTSAQSERNKQWINEGKKIANCQAETYNANEQ